MQKSILLLCLLVIFCIIGSAGTAYYVAERKKQAEIDNINEFYEHKTHHLNVLLNTSYDEIDYLEEELEEKSTQLSNVETELESVNQSLQENVSELEKLKSGDKYDLHDPTYQEFINFIASDKTDEEEYIDDIFDCEHFSQMFNNNAEARGLRCAYVMINFGSVGHAIAGFDTVDQGMVYVEVQNDELVENLEIGKEYWTECVVPNGNYYYQDAPDDTITDIIVVW